MGILVVDRQSEFAPVKHSESLGGNTPSKAANQVLAVHSKWLSSVDGLKVDAGAINKVEISPLLSYEGENLGWLKHVFRKRSLTAPGGYLDQQGEYD